MHRRSRDIKGVLSIGRLSGPGSERYYLDKVAKGREDYYAGRGELPGRWAGSGVDLLMETDHEVSAEQFSAMLQGNSPATGEPLGNAGERSVHGFDLTFRAPKSVSLLFGVGEPGVATAAREAHELAVDEALGYLEREACWTRRGKGGKEHVKGEGFVAAAFRHRTSRAGDPLLHTHVVIANATHAAGKWTALDSRQLYRHAKTAGYLYQAALRLQLTQTLGVEWAVVRNGMADIVGVPRPVIEHFSRRRTEILEYMAERGEHSAKAAQIATLQTRRAKQQDLAIDRLRADWRARAIEHGFGPSDLQQLLDRSERFPADALEQARMQADAPLPELTEMSSTFDRRDVLQAWAERHRAGISVTDAEHLADGWMDTGRATPVEPETKSHIPRRFSTPEMLHLEADLVESSRCRRDRGAGRVPEADVAAALLERPELSPEQTDMVRALTTSGDGVQVIRAAAGTGKTYALDAAREIWEQADYQVVGCALSARAAVELQDQTGVPSTTIAKIRNDLQHGRAMSDRSVLIVDEAGMAGTRAIAELAESASETNTKLVLCGDDRQLPEIDAGGALRGLARHLGSIELREVRRQRHEWDRQALDALRDGRLEQWADAYREHDRIIAGTDAASTRSRLVADWHRAVQDHPSEDIIMLAHRRADVAELNDRARARLQAAGDLSDVELHVGHRAFAIGDRVVTCRNDRTNDITNGTRGTVSAIDLDNNSLSVRFDSGIEQVLPPGYVDDGHLEYGYAMTAHRAQGATVDRAFVLGSDDLYREWGYTALSRHREEARFYVNLGHEAQLSFPGLDVGLDRPEDPLLSPLHRRRAKHFALDELRANRMPMPELPDLEPDLPLTEEARHAAHALLSDLDRPPAFPDHGPDLDLDPGLDLGP